MTTDFDIELKDTLRDLAEEAGPIPPTIAPDAFRGGVRIRHRRQGLFAVSAVAILAVIATSTTLAVHSVSGTPAAAKGRTGVVLTISDRTGGVSVSAIQHTLQHRFTAAGIKVVSVKTVGTGKLDFVLGGKVSASTLKPLVATNNLEFRTVLKTFPDLEPHAVAPKDGTGDNPTLAEVKAKLGAAYTLAATITDPQTVTQAQADKLAPFAKLTPAEVGVLPPIMQFAVPIVSCAQLNARSDAAVAGDHLRDQVVVCGGDYGGGRYKYLLDAAAFTGAGKATVAGPSNENTLGWMVNLTFTKPQQLKWQDLTTQLYNDYVNSGGQTYREVAIILDTTVLTAPAIEAPDLPSASISGTSPLTEKSVKATAQAINGGPLDAVVSIDSIG